MACYDYYRTPVKYQGVDIDRFVGAFYYFEGFKSKGDIN